MPSSVGSLEIWNRRARSPEAGGSPSHPSREVNLTVRVDDIYRPQQQPNHRLLASLPVTAR